jgi:CHAD domain-containing protein
VQALPTPADGAKGHGLSPWAGEVLDQRLRRLLREARRAHRLDLDGLHALRIRCKQLRYAQQCLLPLLQGRRQAQRVATLAVLVHTQERLGTLNDLAGALARLQACPLPEAAVWRRQLQRQQAGILRTLPALQRDLRQGARR